MSTPMAADQANAVYDLLVEHAGASKEGRELFIGVQVNTAPFEYRFGGSLGFGGKFWRTTGLRCTDRDLSWSVSCYPEGRTPDRDAAIEITNRALSGLLAMQDAAWLPFPAPRSPP